MGDPDSGLRLAVLHPPRKTPCVETPTDGVQSTNDESLVLRLLRRGEGLVLLPGDAGNRVLRRLLDLRANVLIALHHGSDTGFLPDFYKAVQPRLVLASCGFQNSYGHPGRKLRLVGATWHTFAHNSAVWTNQRNLAGARPRARLLSTGKN